jgi:hypothetical protein
LYELHVQVSSSTREKNVLTRNFLIEKLWETSRGEISLENYGKTSLVGMGTELLLGGCLKATKAEIKM